MRFTPIMLALTAITTTHSLAHEFWIDTRVAENGALHIQLMHGERFQGHPVPRNNPMIRAFELIGTDPNSDSVSKVLGRHGATTSFLPPNSAGIVVYESEWIPNELSAESFEAYLAEEQLDHISAERRERGETSDPGIERYKRCAKSIVDQPAQPLEDRWVGLPLEIHIEQAAQEPSSGKDAGSSQSGYGALTATVRFMQAPLPSVRVVVVHAQEPDQLIELVTDSNGEIRFTPDRPGRWMLTTLHMTRSTDADSADWESFWASLTFSI